MPPVHVNIFTAWSAVVLFIAVPSASSETLKMYSKTDVGKIEIKTLPPSRLMVTEAAGSYFDSSSRLFYRLFDYIKAHEVAMTAPVEGSFEGARMAFHAGPGSEGKELPDTGDVSVVTLPERKVAAIGARGSYREKNVRKYLKLLEDWLGRNPGVEAAGPAYAVYWNPPFIPWFLRTFEVHIPLVTGKADGPGR